VTEQEILTELQQLQQGRFKSAQVLRTSHDSELRNAAKESLEYADFREKFLNERLDKNAFRITGRCRTCCQ
jgi:hypothetical protein